MKIKTLKEIIGEELYFNKKIELMNKLGQVQKLGIKNTNLIVCHMCKQVVEKEYVRCSRSDMTPIIRHYSNSPKVYYLRLIAFNYCYYSEDAPDIEEELSYYLYYLCENKRRYCNRFFCINCLEKVQPIKI